MDDASRKGLDDLMISKTPLRKLGTAEDVAKLVSYFSGDAATFITGAEIIIDGGFSL